LRRPQWNSLPQADLGVSSSHRASPARSLCRLLPPRLLRRFRAPDPRERCRRLRCASTAFRSERSPRSLRFARRTSSPGLATTPGQKVGAKPGQKTEPKTEQKTKVHHGLFSLLRKHPPCRAKIARPRRLPGARTANSRVPRVKSHPVPPVWRRSNPTGMIVPTHMNPTGRCETSQLVPCVGPSAAVLAAQEQEVERLDLQRNVACGQAPLSKTCADLIQWCQDALLKLEELRREAARCRVP
jgi:hypothetical protein